MPDIKVINAAPIIMVIPKDNKIINLVLDAKFLLPTKGESQKELDAGTYEVYNISDEGIFLIKFYNYINLLTYFVNYQELTQEVLIAIIKCLRQEEK